jgi:GGDEF domain-containing protein
VRTKRSGRCVRPPAHWRPPAARRTWSDAWGGDEFALILPEMAIADADTVGRRIQRLLAAAGLSGSLGFAAAREGDTDPRALVLRADRSLLDAKAAGKGTHRIAA